MEFNGEQIFHKRGRSFSVPLVLILLTALSVSFITRESHIKRLIIVRHPEKNQYEFSLRANGSAYNNIPHTPAAIHTAAHFAYFFVEEARRNNHSFQSTEEELASLIWNWAVNDTNHPYSQTYYFNWSDQKQKTIGTFGIL